MDAELQAVCGVFGGEAQEGRASELQETVAHHNYLSSFVCFSELAKGGKIEESKELFHCV